MSKFSVLAKLLDSQSIKQIVQWNARHLTTIHCAGSIKSNRTVNRTCITPYCDIGGTFRHVNNGAHRMQNSCQIHTNSSLCNAQNKNDTTKNTSVDQFRAEEERIEREYERQQQQLQQQQGEKPQAEQAASESENVNAEDTAKIQETREKILNASLAFVKIHGWSREAIAQGAESIGYPGVVHGMFPNGAIELIQHFIASTNAALIEQLKQEMQTQSTDGSSSPSPPPSPKEFAIRAIRLRLEMLIPYKEHWPQALAIMTLPQNVQVSLAHMLTLVDDICYCAGDRSVNIDWYTRRIGIASIYKMAELHMIQDTTIDHADTWTFLERRMDEALQIQEFLSVSDQKAQLVTRTLGSAFETARNILGINCDKK